MPAECFHKISGLDQLEKEARAAERGLWGLSLNPVLPADFRRARQSTGSNRSGRWLFVRYDNRRQRKIFRYAYDVRQKISRYGR